MWMNSIALYDEDKIFLITDEKYVEELQMQEALMSSAAKTQTPGRQAKAGGEIFRSDSCGVACQNRLPGVSVAERGRERERKCDVNGVG
nr:E3 ubiquitin-protein ligase RNF144B-like [Ipomoea batatas]